MDWLLDLTEQGTWMWVGGGLLVSLVLGVIGARAGRSPGGSGGGYSHYSSPFTGEQTGSASDWVTIHESLARHRRRWARQRMVGSLLAVVGLVVAVYLFDVGEFRAFVHQFWKAGLLLLIGAGGIANAKRLVDLYNYWTPSYTISVILGVGGLLWGCSVWWRHGERSGAGLGCAMG